MSFLNRLTRLSIVTINQTIGQQFKQQTKYQINALKNRRPILISQRNCSLQPELKSKLDKLVKQQKIVLFMKGEKNAPKCGFSNVITQVLSNQN